MIRFLTRVIATLFMLASQAEARDCTPVETAPGVKSRPVGCADTGRELTAKKPAEPDNNKGVVYNRDGTTVRVNGSMRVDTGVINGKR